MAPLPASHALRAGTHMAASRRWWQGPPVPVGLVLAHLLTGFAVVFPGRPLCPAALAASGCGLAALLATKPASWTFE